MNYYNEINKFAAQWLRNLIAAGHIAPGIVDERSIEDVRPDDLRGFTQCHFFAGIGVWSYALRRAGWPDDRPVWTGSCPCQPFSQAGEGSGFDDERHLWPHFHWLIQERRPAAILGEQVASKDAEPWINLVHADLEGLGYAFGAVPFPSASVGAPHIRDRLFWVAHAKGSGPSHGRARPVLPVAAKGGGIDALRVAHNDSHGCSAQPIAGVHHAQRDAEPCGSAGWMGDTNLSGPQGSKRGRQLPDAQLAAIERAGEAGGLADLHQERRGRGQGVPAGRVDDGADAGRVESHHGLVGSGEVGYVARPAGPVNGFWADADWLLCRDGKFRPVEPGTFPLVASAPGRVGRLRANWYAPAGKEGQGHRAERLKGYGNAINAEAARVFIETVMESA